MTDLVGGNVDMSLVLCFSAKCVLFMFLFIFIRDLIFLRSEQTHYLLVVILGGQHVDIALVLILFSEMRVFRRCVF